MSFDLSKLSAESFKIQIFLNDPNKKYCFLNGSGGSGKTRSISHALQLNSICGNPVKYKFLTPTGKAAIVAKGYGMESSTFHSELQLLSYSCLQDIERHIIATYKTKDEYYKQVIMKKFVDEKVRVVFIDEVSMINNEMIQFLIDQLVIKPDNPIKLVFSGDYHQFEAVITDEFQKRNPGIGGSLDYLRDLYNTDPSAFEIIEFVTRYRSPKEHDSYNAAIVNLRNNVPADLKKEYLIKLIRTYFNVYEDGKLPTNVKQNLTFIEHTQNRVSAVNDEFIKGIHGRYALSKEHVRAKIAVGNRRYNSIAEVTNPAARAYLENMQFDEVIELIEGTRILFLMNSTTRQYVNGDEGIVVEIKPTSVMINKKTSDGSYSLIEIKKHEYTSDPNLGLNITVLQWPFKLAYARTSHKAQGDGFSNLHLNFLESFNNTAYNVKNLYRRAEVNWKYMYVCVTRVIDPSTVWISEESVQALENEPDFFKYIDFDKLNFKVNK